VGEGAAVVFQKRLSWCIMAVAATVWAMRVLKVTNAVGNASC
jgi:hypothetical protein